MKNLCKSYALNVMAMLAIIVVLVFRVEFIDMFTGTGGGDIMLWLFLPLSIAFFSILIWFLSIEYLFYIMRFEFAFNFPYKKIKFRKLYFFVFYVSLICAIMPAIVLLPMFLIKT